MQTLLYASNTVIMTVSLIIILCLIIVFCVHAKRLSCLNSNEDGNYNSLDNFNHKILSIYFLAVYKYSNLKFDLNHNFFISTRRTMRQTRML